MKLSDILAKVGLAPKNLNEAREIIEPAKATLDSVAALFAAAGLDLDTMLAAGPDSLKAHLDGLSAKDAELATAQASVTDLTAKLETANNEATVAKEAAAAASNVFSVIGFQPEAGTDIKPAFEKHVSLRAAELLAKTGTPPLANVIAPEGKQDVVLTDDDHLAAYEALPFGSKERAEYSTKHYNALVRADNKRRGIK